MKKWLEQNGYGGLYDDDCGCSLDDLMPCDGAFVYRCMAGYKCESGVGPDKPEVSE